MFENYYTRSRKKSKIFLIFKFLRERKNGFILANFQSTNPPNLSVPAKNPPYRAGAAP